MRVKNAHKILFGNPIGNNKNFAGIDCEGLQVQLMLE
jgi:hypothetical protein